jgi:terpene synthase-like protein
MKHASAVQDLSCVVLERIQKEYAELIASSQTFSLQELFNSDQVHLQDFCGEFSPHPQSAELRMIVESFGEQYGTWLANSKYYINCACFLYPMAQFDRMVTIMKNLSIGFYLNDVMGRDVFKFLTPEKQSESRQMIDNLANLNETLRIPSDAHPIELANAKVLSEFRDNSPKGWFRKFLNVYNHHLSITHLNGDSSSLGHISGIHEYIENRCYYAGVYHIIMWIEFSEGAFLDWGKIRKTSIFEMLKQLHSDISTFAALSNDLFSFEGEVINNDSDSNLIAILVLNNPELSLKAAIFKASEIIRNLLIEIVNLLRSINRETTNWKSPFPTLTNTLTIHLSAISRCVQAIWVWHVHTHRYKRPQSIWKETRLFNETI